MDSGRSGYDSKAPFPVHRLKHHGEIAHAAVEHGLEPLKTAGQQWHRRAGLSPIVSDHRFFACCPVPLSFDQRVWRKVMEIPPGRLATYGQIAVLIGAPGCARQVGWALRRLPLPLSSRPFFPKSFRHRRVKINFISWF